MSERENYSLATNAFLGCELLLIHYYSSLSFKEKRDLIRSKFVELYEKILLLDQMRMAESAAHQIDVWLQMITLYRAVLNVAKDTEQPFWEYLHLSIKAETKKDTQTSKKKENTTFAYQLINWGWEAWKIDYDEKHQKKTSSGYGAGAIVPSLPAKESEGKAGRPRSPLRNPLILNEAENALNLPTQAQIQANAKASEIPLEVLDEAQPGNIRLTNRPRTQRLGKNSIKNEEISEGSDAQMYAMQQGVVSQAVVSSLSITSDQKKEPKEKRLKHPQESVVASLSSTVVIFSKEAKTANVQSTLVSSQQEEAQQHSKVIEKQKKRKKK